MYYEVVEISLADTQRIFEYMQEGVYGVEFNLKGFDYPWIIKSRPWKKGERILDVGAAYSPLPIHIAKTYGCEVWVADDFGCSVEDSFWLRNQSHEEHIQRNPEIKYVLERLGDPQGSSLPEGYFDCIYSASAIEHVPPSQLRSVFRHMDYLLRPGGEMLHAVDIALPTNRGLPHVVLAVLFDFLYPFIPFKLRQRFAYETPRSFVRFAMKDLKVHPNHQNRDLSVINMVLNPEIMVESMQHTYNRIVKDGFQNQRHFRVTSLVLHMRKKSASTD
jgi:SAM-dependent methyltransferase